jgi:3-oxoacyl-[acyl-carrier protein] reductase
MTGTGSDPDRGRRSVSGRVVVVTGSGRGLGRDYARLLAGEGAAVAVADIDGAAAEKTAAAIASDISGSTVLPLVVDVTDPASTGAMARSVASELGDTEILINNAGVWGDLEPTPLTETSPDYWDLVMGVNLKGALLCSQAVVGPMRAAGWGRIINISSIGAYMPSGVYGVSKLALNQLTYALATELGPDGITVNAVAPGPIDNEATRNQLPESAIEKMVNGTAVKRMGDAEDLFGMIRYLATDEAQWVTGQTILVNGGFNARL